MWNDCSGGGDDGGGGMLQPSGQRMEWLGQSKHGGVELACDMERRAAGWRRWRWVSEGGCVSEDVIAVVVVVAGGGWRCW